MSYGPICQEIVVGLKSQTKPFNLSILTVDLVDGLMRFLGENVRI